LKTGVFLATLHRQDIDGLRALAVILVVLCHAGFKTFSGGFIGVDIFFVISGFVVTNSIRSALAENRFSFFDFYIRRAKRLAPALYFVMFITLGFALLFLVPDAAHSVLKVIGAVTIFTSNIYISKLSGYFDPKAEDLPLLHTWSLSVEEQFYLVLPLFLFLTRKQSPKRMLVVAAIIFIVSLAASQWAVLRGSPGSYYLFHYRAFEFITGVMASLLAPLTFHSSRRSDAVFGTGLALILVSAFTFDAATPFPGFLALLPCLGTFAIIMGGQTSPLAKIFLANVISVGTGKISYSLYLWHWPVFFAMWHFNFHSKLSAVFGIAIALVFSVLTYRYIEQPSRHIHMPGKKAAFVFVGMPLMLVVCLTITAKLSHNFVFLYPENFQKIYKTAIASTDNDRSSYARIDLPLPVKEAFGDPSGTANAIVWGDSHALSFRNFFDALGKEYRLTMYDMSLAGCPPVYFSETLAIPEGTKVVAEKAVRCKDNNKLLIDYILSHDEIKFVFMSSRWAVYEDKWIKYDGVHPVFSSEQVQTALSVTIRTLIGAGKEIVIVDDMPEIPEGLKDCVLYRDIWFGNQSPCVSSAKEALAPYRRYIGPLMKKLTTEFPTITIIHTYKVLCDSDWCRMDINGRQVYQVDDTNHLAVSAGPIFYEAYRRKYPAELDQVFGRPDPAYRLAKGTDIVQRRAGQQPVTNAGTGQ
jgi:peptidoglycan/LPS O-acetylase OafA/YrhL